MYLNLEKALKNGRTVLDKHAVYDIMTREIEAIAERNNFTLCVSIIDAFVLGFLQGQKAGKARSDKNDK